MLVVLAMLILVVTQHVFHYIDFLFADLISGRRLKTPTSDDDTPWQSRGPDSATLHGQPENFVCADLSHSLAYLGAQAGMIWIDYFDRLMLAVVEIRMRLSHLTKRNPKREFRDAGGKC